MSGKTHFGHASWFAFGASFVLFAVCLVMTCFSSESKWLLPLFFLPLVLQLFGSLALSLKSKEAHNLRVFYVFYVSMMLVCLFSYLLLWLAYLLRDKKVASYQLPMQLISILAVLCTVVIILFVVIMTIVILKAPHSYEIGNDSGQIKRLLKWVIEHSDKLKFETTKAPSHALSLFFSAFLAVSYLFGFAFAFHDKGMTATEHALYMKNLRNGDTEGKPAPHSEQGIVQAAATPARPVCNFIFEEGRATPETLSSDLTLLTKGTKHWLIADRRNANNECLKTVVRTVMEATKDDNKVRVTLTGRANEKPVTGSAYQSNYELSQARAQNVGYALMQRLSEAGNNQWRNLEYVIIPASNEPDEVPLASMINPDKGDDQRLLEVNNNKIVEVRVDSVSNDPTALQMQSMNATTRSAEYRSLDLIDYIYFANYTITTTGYGDIMPATPYAKFVCSLANIFEVFFLVVFFNLLLSLRNERRGIFLPLPANLGQHSPVSASQPPGDG
jgi:hypothetical protein